MNLRNLAIPVVLAASAAAMLGACSPPGPGSGDGAAGSGPIKVAIIGPQSGVTSFLGESERQAIQLAFDQANKAGGIDGRKIEFTVYDDKGDPTTGSNLARRAASEGAIAVMGSSLSGVTLAIAPILTDDEIPQFTTAVSPGLPELESPFLFMSSPTSEVIDETLADFLVTKKGYESIALITNNGAFGKGEHDAFTTALKSRQVEPVADEVVTPDQQNFSAALTKIREAKPEVLFIGAEAVQSGLVAKQARDLGIDAVFAGTVSITDIYVKTAGADTAEGTVAATSYIGDEPGAQEFSEAFQKVAGNPADIYAAKAYSGALVLVQALKNSKGATGADLADAIRSANVTTVAGDYQFDQNGVGLSSAKLAVMQGGKLVSTPDSASPS